MKILLRWLGVGAVAGALLAGFASAEDSVEGVIDAPAGGGIEAGSRGEFLNEVNQIRQETRSQRDITNLRIEQMEREMERSTGYVQNLLIAFLIAGGIVVFLVLNTIRHQSRVNIYRMRQLIRDSERALAEIERHVQRPEYDHFQVARRLDRVMNHAREHDRSMPQKMITDVYSAADDPTLPVSLHYQANALKCEQAADWRQAISFWERLHQMDDGNPEVLLHLASCYKGLAETTPGPEASVYRDTSLRFFQIYTQRNRNLQQLQANIASPLQQAPAARQQPAVPAPPPAVSAPPPAAAVTQPDAPSPTAAPAETSAPAAAPAPDGGIAQTAGRAVRSQMNMVGDSASRMGSSFKRAGASVAAGIYDRIKSSAAGIESRQQGQQDEEPVYVPERKKVDVPPINYYKEEKAAAVPATEKEPVPLKLAAAAVPPPAVPARQPDQQQPAASAKPAQTFAAPTIKQSAGKPPAAAAAKAKKARPAAKSGRGKEEAAATNGSGRPAERKAARTRKSSRKAAKMSSASRFGEHMQAAEQARKRADAAAGEEKARHLQEEISHYQSAAKYSTSLSMYRLWGNALIDQARLVPEQEAGSLLVDAADKFRNGEKIKPGSMIADLALAYALAGNEDECRQAVGRCLKNGTENLGKCFGSSAFDRYRTADWFVSAQQKISA